MNKRLSNIIDLQHIIIAIFIALLFPIFKYGISILIILWVFVILFQKNKIKLFKENLENNTKIIFWTQIFLFILIIFSYFFSENKEKALQIIEMRLSLFVFPILFVLSKQKLIKKKKLILKTFILGNIIAASICILFALYNSINFIDGNLIFNPIKQFGISYFEYSHFSLFLHPTYFSMYLNFSIVIILNFLDTSPKKDFKKTLLHYLLIVLFAISVYFLSSRAGLITLILIFIWRIILITINKGNLFLKIIILSFTIISIFYIFHNNRFVRMCNQVEQSIKLGKQSDNYPERFILWENSIDIIQQNFWLGTTPADAQVIINKNLTKYNNFIKKTDLELNSHNQYLQTFVEFGIIGLVVLMFIFGGGFFIAIKRKQTLFIAFLLIILFNFFFESILNKFSGIVFIFYFFNYFLFVHKQKKPTQ